MADWHPMLETVEPIPGLWLLVDSFQREYGRVRLVRRGSEVGYRAEFRGELVGYFLTLRAACFRVHMAFVDSHGRRGDGVWGLYKGNEQKS